MKQVDKTGEGNYNARSIFLFEEKETGKWKITVFLDDKLSAVIEFEIR